MLTIFLIFFIRQAHTLIQFDSLFLKQPVFLEFIYIILLVGIIYLFILGCFYLPLKLIIKLDITFDVNAYPVKLKPVIRQSYFQKFNYIGPYRRTLVLRI
jgi:hypothetical protein